MKLPSTISKILTNKYVLYFVAFLSLTNVLGYAMRGDLNHIIVFMLLGVIMTYFSKNMTIVLLVSLLVSNLFSISILLREGFEGEKDDKKKEKKKDEPQEKESNLIDDDTLLSSTIDSTDAQEDASSPQGESFEVGRGKRNPKIDYASTITDAYSQLNELIGKDGIKSLTNDTQTLMKQQLQLADSMKAIGPLIEGITPLLSQVKGMMGGLDSNSLEGIKSMAKSFSVGQQ